MTQDTQGRTTANESNPRIRNKGTDWIVLTAVIVAAGLMVMSVAADGAERLTASAPNDPAMQQIHVGTTDL